METKVRATHRPLISDPQHGFLPVGDHPATVTSSEGLGDRLSDPGHLSSCLHLLCVCAVRVPGQKSIQCDHTSFFSADKYCIAWYSLEFGHSLTNSTVFHLLFLLLLPLLFIASEAGSPASHLGLKLSFVAKEDPELLFCLPPPLKRSGSRQVPTCLDLLQRQQRVRAEVQGHPAPRHKTINE